jgi:hypothetical protein
MSVVSCNTTPTTGGSSSSSSSSPPPSSPSSSFPPTLSSHFFSQAAGFASPFAPRHHEPSLPSLLLSTQRCRSCPPSSRNCAAPCSCSTCCQIGTESVARVIIATHHFIGRFCRSPAPNPLPLLQRPRACLRSHRCVLLANGLQPEVLSVSLPCLAHCPALLLMSWPCFYFTCCMRALCPHNLKCT